MILETASELSSAVNAEARQVYPSLAKKLGMSSMASAYAPRIALRLETPYPYRFVQDDEFYPSGENGFGRVISANREEGLQEIHRTISTEDREHGWIYLPKTHQWIDTSTLSTESSVEVDQYVHVFLSNLFSEVEMLHTHPDKTIRQAYETFPSAYTDNYLLEAAIPSSDDLIHHNQMTARISPKSLQVSSVVSHYGVTTYTSKDTQGEFGGFRIDAYDWIIEGKGEPIEMIHAGLQKVASKVLLYSGIPAINIEFNPLVT